MIVMNCLKSVRYSVLVNGIPTRYITPTRGIRQGDPLSPYLFILGAEGLSSLFSRAVDQGVLKGCPSAPKVHHLFFADDNFLFGEATEVECNNFQALLKIYELASGQRINLQKSSVVFSRNVHTDVQDSLSSILGVPVVDEHEYYLGLPIHIGRSKMANI